MLHETVNTESYASSNHSGLATANMLKRHSTWSSVGKKTTMRQNFASLASDDVQSLPTTSEGMFANSESSRNQAGHNDNNENYAGSDASDNNSNYTSKDGNDHANERDTNDSMGENTISTPSSAPLGKATLAVMLFYSVSGGPFGVESAVRSGGYMYSLLGFIIGPFIWSLQEALMTAELACVFPEASGGMAWVEEAFGPLAGWMAGYLGWMAGATDNAIYPVLFLDYLVQVLGSEGGVVAMHPLLRFIGLGITSICLAYINWLGLDVVGQMSIMICFIAMSPFLLMTVIGLFQVDTSRWFELPNPAEIQLLSNVTDDDLSGGFFPYAGLATTGILWRPFLNNLFWNLNSFDAGASFSADVGSNPERVIPAAMMYSVVMVSVSYVIPLAIAIGATSSEPYQWEDGYLAKIAGEIAGPWLEGWTILAAGISNIAMFQAELSADAFQLMGMADRGHVPKIFARRSRHGTPTFGIVLGTVVIVGMGASGLDKLIEMLNFNYSISLLMEYTAFLYLRVSRPELVRPWKIPLNTVGCFVFFAPTYFFILLVLALSDYKSLIFSLCANVFGLMIYFWKHGYLTRIQWDLLCRPQLWYTQASVTEESFQDHLHQRTQSDGIMMLPEIVDADICGEPNPYQQDTTKDNSESDFTGTLI